MLHYDAVKWSYRLTEHSGGGMICDSRLCIFMAEEGRDCGQEEQLQD